MKPYKRTLSAIAAAAIVALTPVHAHAGAKGWDDASTIGRDALVIAALGLPAVKGDWNGTLQAGGSIAAAKLVTMGMKEAFPAWRPDRSNRKSFPSGHTAVSFAAAATLQNRHGWEVGLPAHIVAAFVGIGRVQADKHRWRDVAVGAVVGELSGLLITRRRNAQVQVFPWAERSGGGMALAMRF